MDDYGEKRGAEDIESHSPNVAGGSDSDADNLPTQVDYDAAAEARVRRKLDFNLMPLVFVMYMLAFLDRGNIGNARIAGMQEDLDLVGDRYDWLLTIFYITYILFEFCVLLWKAFPPHLVASCVVFCWGLMAALQAAVQSWAGLMVLRFFLGIFEAAFGPGVVYYLSFFYLRRELGFRCGIFISAAPIASTFAGALAYGITSGHAAFASWRLLLLVEGLPTICLAPVAYFCIPDSPDKARFLNTQDKAIVKSRALRRTGTSETIRKLNFKDLGAVLIDPKAWLNSLMYFSVNVSYASLPVFLPTILADMGYSNINAQGLSAPPYFAAFLAALGATTIADRTQQRALVLIVTALVGAIGYLILATVETVGVRYFAVYLAASGVFSTIPNIIAWTLNNQGNDTGRGTGIVILNLVGQCGPVLGTRLYPTTQSPRYVEGMSVCAAFMFFSALLFLIQRLLLAWENRKLDRQYGPRPDKEVEPSELVGAEDFGPNFRYVL